jgi:hypothetical protein
MGVYSRKARRLRNYVKYVPKEKGQVLFRR